MPGEMAIGTLNVGIGSSPSGTFTNVYTVSGQQTASETDPFQQVSIDVSALQWTNGLSYS